MHGERVDDLLHQDVLVELNEQVALVDQFDDDAMLVSVAHGTVDEEFQPFLLQIVVGEEHALVPHAQGDEVLVGAVGERAEETVRLSRGEDEREELELLGMIVDDDQRSVRLVEGDQSIDVVVHRRAVLPVRCELPEREHLLVVRDIFDAAKKLIVRTEDEALDGEERLVHFDRDLVVRIDRGVKHSMVEVEMNGVEVAIVDRLAFLRRHDALRLLVANDQGEVAVDVDDQTDEFELENRADVRVRAKGERERLKGRRIRRRVDHFVVVVGNEADRSKGGQPFQVQRRDDFLVERVGRETRGGHVFDAVIVVISLIVFAKIQYAA